MLLFPVVVNFYVKPIGPLLSPLFLQKSNSRDFQGRSPYLLVCGNTLLNVKRDLWKRLDKSFTEGAFNPHLRSLLRKSAKETLRLLKSGIRSYHTNLFLFSLAHGETKRIYFHDQTVTKKSLVPFFPDHSLFSPSLM